MIANNQQLEKEVKVLMANASCNDPSVSVNALEAACLILDHKFGKDYHRKNPKMAIRLADSMMKNIRMNDLTSAIKHRIGENLDALKMVLQNKEFNVKETFMDDFADSFRF